MSEEFDTISDMSNSLEESEKFKLIAGEDDKKRMTFFAHSLPKSRFFFGFVSFEGDLRLPA